MTYEDARRAFEALCVGLDLPVPDLRPALPTDPCDYTSGCEVRLNVAAAGDCDLSFYVRHNVGHYLLDLYMDSWHRDDELSNQLADLIADLLGTR